VIDGKPLHGSRHPEMGHFRPRRHPLDEFAGTCPFHGDCLEGLASGPAISRRWGRPLSELPETHPAHDIVADYLAQLAVAQQALLAPGRIALGGGVMATPGLIERVRHRAADLSGGYFPEPHNSDGILIGPPSLGDRVGLLGALALALDACGNRLDAIRPEEVTATRAAWP
jgi:fructokinase